MAKLNTPAAVPHEYTHEGAAVRAPHPEQRLRRSVMACLLWEDTFYEDGQDIAQRIHETALQCSEQVVAAVALEARTVHGIRHAPLWLALSLFARERMPGSVDRAKLIERLVSRADELGEVIAMYWKDGKRPLPTQLKRGLAAAFHKFDAYQFAKYDRGAIRPRDVMFLVHPKPRNDEQAELFRTIANDKLVAPDTWEVALSGGADKKETFTRLLKAGRLGDLALLRNLRNMAEAGVEPALVNEALGSRAWKGVLPHQFITAVMAAPRFAGALDVAIGKMALGFRLPGTTAVLIDVSGSMDAPVSKKSKASRVASAVGVALGALRASDAARVFAFGTVCREVPAYPSLAMIDIVRQAGVGHGTNIGNAVQVAARAGKYDRMIIITDAQSHDLVPPPPCKGYVVNVAPYRNGVGYGPWTNIDGFSAQILRYVAEV